MKKQFLLVTLLLISVLASAQITVNPNANATNLANRLIGSGVNVTNAVMNCPPLASGDFIVSSTLGSNLGLDSGIVLTSGTAASTTATSNDGINGSFSTPAFVHGTAGDADLSLLCGQTTNDACILEFDFETTGDSIKFNYVFGSSEYQSFTCSNFNDVFGFFVSGPGIAGPFSNGAINIATVPGSGNTCPVGVSTIYCPDTINTFPSCCNGSPTVSCHANTTGCSMFTTPFATCPYFVCNTGGTTVTYPGFTTKLRAEAQILPCKTYHFKLAIADASDGTLDSGVMLEAGSFTANSVGLNLDTNILSANGRPVIIEGCDSLCLDIRIEKFGVNTYDTIKLIIQGSALNNIDYNFLQSTLVFTPDPADTVKTICIGALADGLKEGTETIVIYLQNYCSNTLADSIVIEIIDSLGADFNISNNGGGTEPDSICLGAQFIYTPFIFPLTGLGPLTYSWNFGDGTIVSNAPPVSQVHLYANPGIYNVKLYVADSTGCTDSATRSVFVDIPPYVELSVSPTEICLGEKVFFTDSIAPHTYNWFYDFDDGYVRDSLHNPVHVFQAPGVYNVSITGEYLICPDATESVEITVNDFSQINLGADKVYCPGFDSAQVLFNLNNPSQILTWSTGLIANEITAKEPGQYWAQGGEFGCLTTDSIWIKRDCYLNIPNTFSPNADGTNDYFIPRQLLSSGIIEFDMKIMNRWGELIFTTAEVNGRGWDGKFGGQDQPVGVYVYQITAKWKSGFKNNFVGNVTLMR